MRPCETWLIVALLSTITNVLCQDFTIKTQSANLDNPYAYYRTFAVTFDEPNGVVYVSGPTYASFGGQPYFNDGDLDAYLVKCFINGTRSWARIVGGPGNQWAYSNVLLANSANIVIFGTTTDSIDGQPFQGQYDSFATKFYSNGTKAFTSQFGTSFWDSSHRAIYDVETNQITTVGARENIFAISYLFTSNLTVSSFARFGTNGETYDMARLSANDLFVTGYTWFGFDGQYYAGTSTQYHDSDIFLSMISFKNASTYWSRLWGTALVDYGQSLQIDTASQRVFVAGYVNGTALTDVNPTGSDAFIACTFFNGSKLWQKTLASSGDDSFVSISLHQPTGSLFAAGFFGGNYPGKPASYRLGTIAVFAQNSTLLYIKYGTSDASIAINSAYGEVAFSSSFETAFTADDCALLVVLNVTNYPVVGALATTILASSTRAALTTEVGFTIPPPAAITSPTVSILIVTDATKTFSRSNVPASTELPSLAQSAPLTTVLDDVGYLPGVNVSSDGIVSLILKYLDVIIGVASGILVGVISIALCCWKARRRNPTKISSDETMVASPDNSTSMNINDASGLISSTANASIISGTTTMVRSDFELSKPGYLQMQPYVDFIWGDLLAEGGGGMVYRGEGLNTQLRQNGPSIVVKHLNFTKDNTAGMLAFQQEISMMHYFRDNEYFGKLLGWSEEPMCLLMKLYDGSLDDWIYGQAELKSKRRLFQALDDIAQGLMAMHTAGFVHCDLKPPNILIDKYEQNKMRCVLTDFGISRIVDDTTLLVSDFRPQAIRGFSCMYAAPEVFINAASREKFTSTPGYYVVKSDLYALALIMFDIFERRYPW